jgi:hypothetical protein
MQILVAVLTLLQLIAPFVARVLAAINESKQGGIKEYDKLLALAYKAVQEVADAADAIGAMPGGKDAGWDRHLRLYAAAVYKTIDAAQLAGIAYKDHQVSQAVSDAYTAWKMATAKASVDDS